MTKGNASAFVASLSFTKNQQQWGKCASFHHAKAKKLSALGEGLCP